MRKLFLIAMLAGLGLTTTAEARDYRVCLRVYQSYHDWYDECSYDTMAQCRMSASGRHADCMINPWYTAPQPAKKKLRKHRRQHRQH
ncbi:hypothetical protein DNX69_08700 [Rhodopseudomonas palustris]|uniref:DUF3551 domain-containing protein n=1 Tax=Rhodopseudomonas palustris TaxID=1076 RepID=A0A323UGJ4_RHOPL|nr:DUF3551 domain-containing protein [Rhodopseudomonas palustris]PZA12092.1 hypothetical protein DNX69_08700 [Rhodopseudomonas palustris]